MWLLFIHIDDRSKGMMNVAQSQRESLCPHRGSWLTPGVVLKQVVETSLLEPGTQAEALGISVAKCQEHHDLWKLEMVDKIEKILYHSKTKNN